MTRESFLTFIAYATLALLSRPGVLLSEEPDTGIWTQEYSVAEAPLLELRDLFAHVSVREAPAGKLTVRAKGVNAAKRLELSQDGNQVKIVGLDQVRPGSLSVTVQDGQVAVVGKVTPDQQIVINGRSLAELAPEAIATEEAMELEIMLPAQSKLRFSAVSHLEVSVPMAQIEGHSTGSASTMIDSVAQLDLTATGAAETVVAQAAEVKAKLSGTARLLINQQQSGGLAADLSGAPRLTASGVFANVTIESQGAGQVDLAGEVRGNLHVKAGGASRISLQGSVGGAIEKELRGAARLHIEQASD